MIFKDTKLKEFRQAVKAVKGLCETYYNDHVKSLEDEIEALKEELHQTNGKIEVIKVTGMNNAKDIAEFTGNKKRIKELDILIAEKEEDYSELVANGEVLRINLITNLKNDQLPAVKQEFNENMEEVQYKMYCNLYEIAKMHKDSMELEKMLQRETQLFSEINVNTWFNFGSTGFKTPILNVFGMRDIANISQYTPKAPEKVLDRYNKEFK